MPDTEQVIDGITFTSVDFGSVEFLLQTQMTEARVHRIFQHIMRGLRESDDPVDIGWALAQAVSNLVLQADGGDAQTMVFRNFLTMVMMVGARRKESVQ